MAAARQHEARKRLLTLARALDARRRVKILYRDGEGEETEREIDALALSWRGGRWLLAAYCHRRDAFRLFRVERILRAHLLETALDGERAPAGFDARFFSSIGYLESGGRPPILVTLRLGAPLGRLARALFPAALLEHPSAGSVLCHLRATRLTEVAKLVISLGSGAELVHPADARTVVEELRSAPP
jgi:predicted DNA-binding transcriptional regulator YafY